MEYIKNEEAVAPNHLEKKRTHSSGQLGPATPTRQRPSVFYCFEKPTNLIVRWKGSGVCVIGMRRGNNARARHI